MRKRASATIVPRSCRDQQQRDRRSSISNWHAWMGARGPIPYASQWAITSPARGSVTQPASGGQSRRLDRNGIKFGSPDRPDDIALSGAVRRHRGVVATSSSIEHWYSKSPQRLPWVSRGTFPISRDLSLRQGGLFMPHDIDRFLSALTASHAVAYRKLIDLTSAALVKSPPEACALETFVNRRGESCLVGPAAIAVSSDALEIADQFQLPAQSDHPPTWMRPRRSPTTSRARPTISTCAVWRCHPASPLACRSASDKRCRERRRIARRMQQASAFVLQNLRRSAAARPLPHQGMRS